MILACKHLCFHVNKSSLTSTRLCQLQGQPSLHVGNNSTVTCSSSWPFRLWKQGMELRVTDAFVVQTHSDSISESWPQVWDNYSPPPVEALYICSKFSLKLWVPKNGIRDSHHYFSPVMQQRFESFRLCHSVMLYRLLKYWIKTLVFAGKHLIFQDRMKRLGRSQKILQRQNLLLDNREKKFTENTIWSNHAGMYKVAANGANLCDLTWALLFSPLKVIGDVRKYLWREESSIKINLTADFNRPLPHSNNSLWLSEATQAPYTNKN